MNEFLVYFQLGIEHILDLNAYDHIVFIVALHAVYNLSEWKKVVILVTAFTIGHSITLALAAFDFIPVDTKLIEFLIPVTILITSIYNVFDKEEKHKSKVRLNYFFALIFGLIHGMGFSNYFKVLMGNEVEFIVPLFSFNLGVEFGQLAIVIAILIALYFFVNKLKVAHRDWNHFVSGATAGISLLLIKNTAYFF